MKARRARAHCWHVSGVNCGGFISRGIKLHAEKYLLESACIVMLQCCRPGCGMKMLIPGIKVRQHNRFREGNTRECTGMVHESEARRKS